jgi:hypothetical protein
VNGGALPRLRGRQRSAPLAVTFRQLPAKGFLGAAYYYAHSFLSASDVVTHLKPEVATPVGLASPFAEATEDKSEAALHGAQSIT